MPKKKPFHWKKGVAYGVPRNPAEPPKPRRRRGLTVITEPAKVRRGRKLPPDEGPREMQRWTGSVPSRYWIKGDDGLWFSVARGSLAHLEDADVKKAQLRVKQAYVLQP